MSLTKNSKFVVILTALLVVCNTSKVDIGSAWDKIADQIGQQIATNLWQNSLVKFMGNDCQYTMEPTLRNFELTYKGRFWCPGLAPFTGVGEHVSRDGAMERAEKDFAKKALKFYLFTKKQLALFLDE